MGHSELNAFAELEASGWSDAGVAQSYASVLSPVAEFCVLPMVELVWAGPGCKALDLCCGHGILSTGLVAAEASVTGLDFSPAMLDLARKECPQAKFICGNAMELPFEDATFDAVTIGFGMPHVPDPVKVLHEARRVLQPGGRIAFSVWHPPTIATVVDYLFTAIAEFGDPGISLPDGPGMFDLAFPDVVHPILEGTGFKDAVQTVVPSEWTLNTPDEPVDAFLSGTVRGKALLAEQPKHRIRAIRNAVKAKVLEQHGGDAPWCVPMPAVITAATAD